MKTAIKTGKNVTYHGITLPEAVIEGGTSYPDVVSVEGICYYVHDFGGVWVGSREVAGKDAGGNLIHAARVAPESTRGISAPVRGACVKARYSAPEIFFTN